MTENFQHQARQVNKLEASCGYYFEFSRVNVSNDRNIICIVYITQI